MGHRTLLFAGAPSGTFSSTCLSSTCDEFPPPLPPAPPSWPQPPFAAPPPDDGSGPSSLPPVVFVVIALLGGIFLLLSYYVIIAKSCLVRLHRRRRRSRDHPPLDEGGDGGGEEFVDENLVDHPIWYIRTVGLSPAAIGSIAVRVYRKGEGLVEGTDCTVCLSEFGDGETLRVLPKCCHAFHLPCIDTWLRSHTNCPLCRAPIVSPIPLPLPPPERLSQSLDGDGNRGAGAVASRGENSNGGGAGEGVESGESNSDGLSKVIDDVNGHDGRLGVVMEEGVVPVRRSASMDSPFLVIELSGRSSTSESRTTGDSPADRANTSSHPRARSLSWSGRLFMPRHNNSNRTSSTSTLPR